MMLLDSIYKTFYTIKIDSSITILASVPAINCLNFCLIPIMHELLYDDLMDFNGFSILTSFWFYYRKIFPSSVISLL